ncbi:hypothetical protein QUF90_03835 [Desulfococcaceae bacterium HSG9]|nr:hypothetical protein [Desulfococcaceae bacterium HSG9]
MTEAFDKECDHLRREFNDHFVNNQKKPDGILFVANAGGGTGGTGLVKLTEFFRKWRDENQLKTFDKYLDPLKTPRYALVIFP